MVNVIGLGYIGLPTAIMLASHGVKVVGTNRDPDKLKRLRARELTFEEKGLNAAFSEAVKGGIEFSPVCVKADFYIISVQTPYDSDTKQVDMSYVNAAVGDVLELAPQGAVIVIESTVAPGSIDRYVRPFVKERGFVIGRDIHLAHAPERIIPGNMIYELVHNNRTVGADSAEIGARVKALYGTFCQGDIVVTDIRTAEMTKVIENTFRCVNIAFANELAKLCRHQGLDVYEVIKICNMHPRVNILNPGPGVGGHCIPIDPWFLVGDEPELTKLIRHSLEVNEAMPDYVFERIKSIAAENKISDLSRVGLYGLTFKENVDDCRESPTLQLLRKTELPLKVYDPYVRTELGKNQYRDLQSFLDEVDMVVIMVGHDEIKNRQELLAGKIILDTRKVCTLPGTYRL